jgi:hypothetical protein
MSALASATRAFRVLEQDRAGIDQRPQRRRVTTPESHVMAGLRQVCGSGVAAMAPTQDSDFHETVYPVESKCEGSMCTAVKAGAIHYLS